MGKWKELAEPLDDSDAPTMKPTQEQVIAWAEAVGIKRCDCEPRCHLHTGGMGSLTALVDLAYEAGRAAENEACAVIAFNAKTYIEAAAAIRARREQ